MVAMRTRLLLVVVAACGGVASPHDPMPCEQTMWGPVSVGTCARACLREPTWEDVPCTYEREDGVISTEYVSFVTPDRIRGFCGFAMPLDITSAEIRFYECTVESPPAPNNDLP
jgi:hypothetical protein